MDIIQAIAQLGFPIAVSAYLLVKLEQRLAAAEKAAIALSADIRAMMAQCQKCNRRD